MVKPLLICSSLLLSHSLSAQIHGMFDHIKEDFKGKKSSYVCLDGKNSIITDVPIKMFGLQFGYTFEERTNIYLGYYGSHNQEAIFKNPTAPLGRTDSNTIWKAYQLNYINLGCEYYFHNSEKWRLSIPFGIGLGNGKSHERRLENTYNKTKQGLMPVELGFFASYKLKWWVWVGAGMGTRICLGGNTYSGSFYSFGLSFRYVDIYKRLKSDIKKRL